MLWKFWKTKYFRIYIPANRSTWIALLKDMFLDFLFYSWLVLCVYGIYIVLAFR